MTICVSRPQADSFTGHAKNVTFLQLTDLIMFFKVQTGLGPQCQCAEMVSSIAWQGKQHSG